MAKTVKLLDNKLTRFSKIEYERKAVQLEHMILRGISNHEELAAALGVSASWVSDRAEKILKRWESKDSKETVELKRSRRIKQFEGIAIKAFHSFDRSQENSTEYSVQSKGCPGCGGLGKRKIDIPSSLIERVMKRDEMKCTICESNDGLLVDHIFPVQKGGLTNERNLRLLCKSCYIIQSKRRRLTIDCKACFGEGRDEYLPGKFQTCLECNGDGVFIILPDCRECQGLGKIVTETTKTKGQPGDPAFLNIARVALESAAKLEGLIENRRNGLMELNKIKNTMVGADGRIIQQEITEMYFEPSDEQLIKAMAAIDELEHRHNEKMKEAGKTKSKLLDGVVIEVEHDERD